MNRVDVIMTDGKVKVLVESNQDNFQKRLAAYVKKSKK